LKIGDRAAGGHQVRRHDRRAAKMVCLDLDHPDIEQFIEWKVDARSRRSPSLVGWLKSHGRNT
jgi:ribonucleoside-diphosphate reductase alpha chain